MFHLWLYGLSKPSLLLSLCVLFVILLQSTSLKYERLALKDIPAVEYQTLYELYNSTNGPDWDWRNLTRGSVPWSFTDNTDPCKDNWQGIQCIKTGTVPDETYHISTIGLASRNLVGTLPPSISNLTYLAGIDCTYNSINGSLPNTLTNLTMLNRIAFTYNNLTGTLPYLGNMTSLTYIALDYNALTGHIPDMFQNFPGLTFLLLQSNQFSGPMPAMTGYFPRLVSLYLGYNRLTGTIASSLGNLTSLTFLDLDGNQFSGTMPASLQNLTSLLFFGVRKNNFHGPVPDYLGTHMPRLQYIYLDANQFTGTLPASLSNLKVVRYLQANDNELTGTIPTNLGDMTDMVYLYLDNNHFSGTLPVSLAQMRFLVSVQVQNNLIEGSIVNCFNHSNQRRIDTIQLSGNQFTGSLPSAIFNLRLLNNFVAVSNCFQGSLPDNICNAQRLTTLALDGLRTASNCRQRIFPSLSSAYELTGDFRGTVPACLFQLESLNTLHLSGNGLTGSLPADLAVSPSLVDLSLSHNILTGTIPAAIQRREWYNLDLSYNRFGGELNDNFYSETRNFTFDSTVDGLNGSQILTEVHLYLENNRLSGRLPHSIKDIRNISVLAGNFYTCNYDKSDLPTNDQNRNSYQCGANSFNVPYYVWIAIISALFTCAFFLWRWRRRCDAYFGVTETVVRFGKWLAILDLLAERPPELQQRLMNISYISLVCDVICKVSMWSCLFIVAVLIPFYVAVSYQYGTHTRESTYTVSAIFTGGKITFGVELALFCLLVGSLAYAFRYYINGFDHIHETLLTDFSNRNVLISNVARAGSITEEDLNNTTEQQKEASKFERISVCVAFFLLSGTVVVGVNIAFVYVALYESTVALLVAQVLLSFFKVMWNLTAAPFLIQWTSNYLSSEATIDRKASRTGFFALQLFVSLFNNIGIPCLVVTVIDPNCLYNVLVAAKSETSSFVYQECEVYGLLTCFGLNPSVSSSTYNPPFSYSYQCSSSFITYYAPTFLYVCFVATFISPLTQIVGYRLHRSVTRGTPFFRLLDYFLPPVFKPVDPSRLYIPREIFDPYFDANMVLISLLTYLGILLTFGAVFPPLAIALLISILAVAYFERFKVGRFIHLVVEARAFAYLDVIELECMGMGSIRKLYQAVWMLASFCFLFYAVFLFDTLGNSVGVGRAVWVLLAVPLVPLAFYLCLRVYWFILARQRGPKRTSSDDLRQSAIELQAAAAFHPDGEDVSKWVEGETDIKDINDYCECERGTSEVALATVFTPLPRPVSVSVPPPVHVPVPGQLSPKAPVATAPAPQRTEAENTTATEEGEEEPQSTFNVLQQRSPSS